MAIAIIEEGEINMKYNSFSRDDFPISLCVDHVAEILNISKAVAYRLVKSQDFPCIKVYGRFIIPRDKFFAWYDKKTEDPL